MGGASEATGLTGPDFGAGVRLADLPEGEAVLGHAHGEAVLVVRTGSRLSAAGASCTHYGGPLAEGLVAGGCVRCPWHHAAFDLDTGEAVNPPARDAIAVFETRVVEGLVRVGARRAIARRSAPPRRPESVVVLGAGPAGLAAAETLRREGYDGPVALVGDEEPVDRPNLSKDYLAGNAPEEWIPLRPAAFFAEQRLDAVFGERAARLDPAGGALLLESGRSLPFGALVLATGASPRRLDLPGAEGDRVHLLRTLADSRRLAAAATAGRRAVVVGSGFIGLEAALSLRARGVEVTVVSRDRFPLERVLGAEVGAFVRAVHEEKGVAFRFTTAPARIEADAVILQDGSRVAADVVVAGVGVVPETALAERAGLVVDRGVVVDATFRTSAPNVWAAGDVAAFPDARSGGRVRVEHFAAAARQGQIAARSILGRPEPEPWVPFFWSNHGDVALGYVGHAPTWDAVEIRGVPAERSFLAAYRREGRVLGVLGCGRDRDLLRAEDALRRGDDAALERLLASA